ncbi:MAG: hypothetical protein P8J93_01440 [SAR86 cluster bacterium]|jgi:putative ABC transport system permease protein|nr:hypothetical protein [SAR86 cluster bacterium]
MMIPLLSVKLFWRELRSGQIGIIFFALVLAIACVSGISLFTDRLEGALRLQTSEFLGGDLKLQTSEPLSESNILFLKDPRNQISEIISFSSMVFSEEKMQFSSIKAVDSSYPLIGSVELFSISSELILQTGPPRRGSIWIDQRLSNLLGVNLNDEVEIGDGKFIVTHIIKSEPDGGSSSFAFAPKVIMNSADIPSTRVVQPGSRIRYSYLFKLKKSLLEELKSKLEQIYRPSHKIIEVNDTQGSIGKAVDRSNNFILLGSLLAVIITAFTIGVGSQRFARRHADYVGILKVLGASSFEVKCLYLFIFLWLILSSLLLGLALGWFIQSIFINLSAEYFPTSLPLPSNKPFYISSLTAVICLVGFAYPSLIKLVNINPSRILKRDRDKTSISKLNVILVFISIFSLIYIYTETFILSGIILMGILLVSSLSLILISLIFFKRSKKGLDASGPLNLAWSELQRRKNANSIQILAFTVALGLTLITLVLKTTLVTSWESSIPEDTPNNFVINISKEELPSMQDFLEEKEINLNPFYPISSARLTKISKSDERKVSFQDNISERTFNITWTYQLPKDNLIVSGNWFNDSSENGLSISKEMADRYSVKVGDNVFVDTAGAQFQTYIQSIRTINWENFAPNFFLIGHPSLFQDIPSTFITSFYIPESKEKITSEFILNFNTVSLVSLDSVINQVKEIVTQISIALEILLVLTAISSLFLTFATIQDNFSLRVQQSAILRTLGASRGLLNKAILLEFICLGLISGILSAILAQLGLYFLETEIFEIEPRFYFSIWLLGPLISIIVVAFLSFILLFLMTKKSPKEILYSS